jgi:hypothetical protein
MARKVDTWTEVKPTHVVVEDSHGNPVKLGSIVEIIERGHDRYRGLLYVVGMEAGGGRTVRLLLAHGRWSKWDYKVPPRRVSLRCYEPVRAKGE